jgi:coenzyme Q-binding protein COQ10
MIRHIENRILPYTADQMHDLVSDINSYPEFIPWCSAIRINSETNDNFTKIIDADLAVSFKIFNERFQSRVIINTSTRNIDVEYIDGPFKFLRNNWTFVQNGSDCKVQFVVEFEFKSLIMQRLIGVVFHNAMKKVVKSFESRAVQLYG